MHLDFEHALSLQAFGANQTTVAFSKIDVDAMGSHLGEVGAYRSRWLLVRAIYRFPAQRPPLPLALDQAGAEMDVATVSDDDG